MKGIKKRLSLIFALCSTVIVCPTILLYSPSSQGQESGSMANAQDFFQRGRKFDGQGQHQEAIAEYTRAIELEPNYAEAYFFRGNALALEGQPQKGIEDVERAAAIFEARGESEKAAAVRQQEEVIRRGIENGEF